MDTLRTVTLELSVGGALWDLKGQTGLFANATYEADIHKQRATLGRFGSLNDAWKENQMKVAILDDYQDVALAMADWPPVAGRAEITVFNDHVADPDAVVERLLPFDVICVMRERTPLSRQVIERLPQLKLIASTGSRNASIDMAAAGSAAFASPRPATGRHLPSR